MVFILHSQLKKVDCINLRKKGFSLKEISVRNNISKSTLSLWFRNVRLSKSAKDSIHQKIKQGQLNGNRSRRIIIPGNKWSSEYINLIGHFMFDGGKRHDGLSYYNRNYSLIEQIEYLSNKYFKLKSSIAKQQNDVYRLNLYSKDLLEKFPTIKMDLISYLPLSKTLHKISFLKAFFDDEGSIYWSRGNRRIRGYQKDSSILSLVNNLLSSLKIESKIDGKYSEIIISCKENIIQFSKLINFSNGIFINHKRKNSKYIESISKKVLLSQMINSYR